MQKPEGIEKTREWLDSLGAKVKAGDIIPDGARDKRDTLVTGFKRFTEKFESLPAEHKINAGMWGVGALMAAFGFASAAKNSVQQDADGNRHVQWSSVGVALLQGALATGCAYIGAQALRSGVGR